MGKLRDKFKRIKREKREVIRDTIIRKMAAGPGLDDSALAEIAEVAQGAHDVDHNPTIEHSKGVVAGGDATLATVIAGIAFTAVRKNMDMDPDMENYIAGGFAVAVSSIFAYIKKRIANRRKMRAMRK